MSTHDDDTDPTGMRALLRGLPDPGPMPDDLVARIHASLADLPPLDGTSERATARGADDLVAPSGVSRGTSRPAWWARHAGHAAVAAVVLVGGGAAISGGLALRGSGADTASSGAAAGPPTTYEQADPDTGSQSLAPGGREATSGGVEIRQSGRAYTAAGLADQAERASTGAPLDLLAAESPGIGPIGTETGARSCLAALGLPSTVAADVDLGTLDGAPAAVLVVTVGGERTAYAVGRDCTTGSPSLLAGPVPLP